MPELDLPLDAGRSSRARFTTFTMPITESSNALAQSVRGPAPPEALMAANEVGASGWRWAAVLAGSTSGAQLGLRGFCVFQSIYWLVSAVTLFGVLRNFSPGGVDGVVLAGRVFTGVILTTALYFCYRHPFTRGLPRVIQLPWILALNLAVIAIGPYLWGISIDLTAQISPGSPYPNFANLRIFSLLTWNIAYFGLVLVLHHQSARLELSEARNMARVAELNQLQMQLNPHFLFNALNAVMGSLETKHQAREIVQYLADFLRFSLAEARPLEPLGRELDALESYLGLQQMRFQNGLQCRIEASPAATRVMVPPMLVQPLLENAFKYGPLNSPVPLRVTVEAKVVDGWLEIRVCNSGRWLEPAAGAKQGTGLDNLRRRLALLIGEQASLSISSDSAAVSIRIRMPVQAAAHGSLDSKFALT